jgi:5-hydroxyisourate hydrolase-like protein (transthyretin family)
VIETKFKSVQIELFNVDDAQAGRAAIATTQTDDNGRWKFDSAQQLLSANQQYELFAPAIDNDGVAYSVSPLQQGDDRAADSDGSAATVSSRRGALVSLTTPAYGSDAIDFDVGFVPQSTLRGVVFVDNDANGRRATLDEPAIVDVLVKLYRNNNNNSTTIPIATTRTQNNGVYTFGFLSPTDNYTVSICYACNDNTPLLSLLAPTTPNVDNNIFDETDSDAIANYTTKTVESRVVAPSFGETIIVDVGFAPETRVGDFVFVDSNGNCCERENVSRDIY